MSSLVVRARRVVLPTGEQPAAGHVTDGVVAAVTGYEPSATTRRVCLRSSGWTSGTSGWPGAASRGSRWHCLRCGPVRVGSG
ncbi:hypothetical protein SAMN05661080_04341 [Modestobacter sp. DSM 44400]|nr:hypothetical protein SAMN05661080_04341 [Modestobacter sp. DSM 44400]